MIEDILKELQSIDLKGIYAEYIVHNLTDKCFKVLKTETEIESDKLIGRKRNPVQILISEEQVIRQILYNLKVATNWCKEISFRDIKGAKRLTKVYVKLDFYLTPRSIHLDIGKLERIRLERALNFSGGNLVILGTPGAGKTTSMKFLTHKVLHGKKQLGFDFPLIIQLKNCSFSKHPIITLGIYKIIYDALGLNIVYPSPGDKIFTQHLEDIGKNQEYIEDYIKEQTQRNSDEGQMFFKRIISNFVDQLNVLIILDGFDEISSLELKRNILKELDEFSLSLNQSRFVLTSRTGEFNRDFSNSTTYEISPLNDSQIYVFTKKWLEKKERAEDLYSKIISSPFYDTTVKPLTIAHLCAIYERYSTIPDKPKSVYRKVLSLLLEEWDEQRSITRTSKYANFTIDRKLDFLSRLSFYLSIKIQAKQISRENLKKAYEELCWDFDLPLNEVESVINELESHTGIFVQTGYQTYEFSHKSLQEFLTADYITKLPVFPGDPEALITAPNELAVATSISSSPNIFMGVLALVVLKDYKSETVFWFPFFTRMLIEKPDFDTHPLAALALHQIYYHLNSIPGSNPERDETISLIKKIAEIKNLETAFQKLQGHFPMNLLQKIADNKFCLFLDKAFDTVSKDFIPKHIMVDEYLIKLITGEAKNSRC